MANKRLFVKKTVLKDTFLRIPLSIYALIAAMVFVASVRMTNVNRYETSWDVLGYYLYLPATFVKGDYMMNDRSWVEEMNKDGRLSGTIYQVTVNDDGEPMYFFLMGMAFFYLPFFLIGHGIAWMTGAPMDGLSEPYQYSLVAGGVVYTILGLWLFRKILRRFFSEGLSTALILIVVFATNYSHHMTYKNLETVNMLFLLMCWLIWSTLRWHEEYKFKQLAQIGISITLMALVKPSEVLAVMIPLLWHVYSRETFRQKMRLLWSYRKQLLMAFGICLLIASPQMLYWLAKTGRIFYDSYKNPGIGLDIFHPHTIDVLFSFKKGWLIYTPVMILALIGLYYFIKRNRPVATALTIYFCITFFIISCWTEWWYGASFSCRPVITSYPILALGMGSFFLHLKSRLAQWSVAVFVLLCLALNQFQWWQMREGIWDADRTTAAYYKAIFLKTQVPPGADTLKSVQRSFTAVQEWNDRHRYKLIKTVHVVKKGASDWSSDEFLSVYKDQYRNITDKDHLWMELDVVYEAKDSVFTDGPFLTVTALHRNEAYQYRAPKLTEVTDTINGVLHAKYQYLTPEIRIPKDELTTYVWNPGKNNLKILSYTIRFYGRKD